MRILTRPAALLLAAFVTACGGGNTNSSVKSPGATEAAKTRALEAGAAGLQNIPPIEAINAYLDGFHFTNGKPRMQMEAHHYCAILNEDLIQCVIFDGNVRDAKLMGVEYIVSAKLFATLPDDEKALWHSHVHEVKSGQLIAPGIPEVAEHELMEKLVGTYGKTIHTWHTDQQRALPVGAPMIMMGFTKDGQIQQQLVSERDKRFNVSTEEKKKERANIPVPAIDALANAWEKGEVRQFTISQKADSALHKHPGKIQK